jgi:hypothetical protein
MRGHFLKILFSLAMAITTCNCRPVPNVSNALENSFRKVIATDEINNQFRIYLDSPKQDSLKIGSNIEISFRNLTDQEIFFQTGFGIRLFIIRDEKWVEILNNDEYYGKAPLLQGIGSQQAMLGGIPTGVRPALPPNVREAEHQELLRIMAVGELMDKGKKTGTLAGSYIDVLLMP